MEHDQSEPLPERPEPLTPPAAALVRHACTERSRSDGWTGERMATFLEVLADTGIVAEACRAVGMSREGAYPLRSRDPRVAAAWRAAQVTARPVVADGLLERDDDRRVGRSRTAGTRARAR